MDRDICFFHCADFHLGQPLPDGSPRMSPLLRTVHVCRDYAVDFLLIAGDFLESSLLTPEDVDAIAALLNELDHLPIVIVTGNHDPLLPGSPWPRIQALRHVTVVGATQMLDWPDFGVRLWCTGFDAPHLREPRFACPGPSGRRVDRLELGLAHADLCSGPSMYNPLTIAAIADSGLDYLALGHIHQPDLTVREAGLTRYAYAGSAVARGFGEPGPHGGRLITMTPTSFSETFIPLTDVEFVERELVLPDLVEGDSWTSSRLVEEVRRQLLQTEGEGWQKNFYRVILRDLVRPMGIIDSDLLDRFNALGGRVQELRWGGTDDDPAAIKDEWSLRGFFVRALGEELKAARLGGDPRREEFLNEVLDLGLRALRGDHLEDR